VTVLQKEEVNQRSQTSLKLLESLLKAKYDAVELAEVESDEEDHHRPQSH
jgi:hypothetical protein